MCKKLLFAILAIYLLCAPRTYGNPVAEFSVSPRTGQVPLAVKFQDLSEPAENIDSWSWDFGDGGTSVETNPVHTYRTEGIFTVQLTVSNADGTDSEKKNDHISVSGFGSPIAEFSASPTAGEIPLKVSFADLSEPAGLIDTWLWVFGDGGISEETNPDHTYTTGGFFSVKLTVSYEGGVDTENKTDLIQAIVSPPPVAEFSATPTTGLVPLSVDFTDLSEGETDNFIWNFGDGAISREQNPNHAYKVAGIYTVNLTVSGSSGAGSETKPNLITVISNKPPTAEFQAAPTVGFAPLNVQFTDLSEGLISSWLWDFGDGLVSIWRDPFHTFENPGIYSIRLTVSSLDGTGVETKTNLINIQEGNGVTAAFTAEPNLGNAPLFVQFFDQSSGNIDSCTWDFGDGGSSSNVKDPNHIYTVPGIYTVKLTVSGNDGVDVHTKENFIVVNDDNLPTAAFSAPTKSGSQSFDVQFHDLSSVNSGTSSVLQADFDNNIISIMDEDDSQNGSVIWLWDFGDGSQSNEQNPIHIYKSSEDKGFDVTLAVTDSRGTHMSTKKGFIGISSIVPGFLKGTVINGNTQSPEADVKAFIDSLGGFQRTKDDGNFIFVLQPGTYKLCAEKIAFQNICEEDLNIGSDKTLTKNINIIPLVTSTPSPEIIDAIIDIKQETIDLTSKRKFPASIQFPEGKDVNDIDVNSIICEGASAARTRVDKSGIVMTAKFNIPDLEGVSAGEDVEFTISGKLTTRERFEGKDKVNVIE